MTADVVASFRRRLIHSLWRITPSSSGTQWAAAAPAPPSSTRGLYFCPKIIHISPPSENYIFPLSRHVGFRLLSWPFCLNSTLICIYFPLLLPLFSFSLFLFFFTLSSIFFPLSSISFTFSPFFSATFHIYSRNDIGWYFFPRGGGGIFSTTSWPTPPSPSRRTSLFRR